MADAPRYDANRADVPRSDPGRADTGRGTWNNVHKTPIYVDAKGRRRRGEDTGDVEKFPAVADDPTAALLARVAALEAKLDAYVVKNDARTITGGGSVFSGTFGNGIKYDPNAAAKGGLNADTLEVTFCGGSSAVVYVESITAAP